MANNSIATRFTEKTYATRADVMHELHTPLVEGFWKMILLYRQEFAKPLGIYQIDKSPITYCLCPSISEKINNCELKLYNLAEKLNMFSGQTNDKRLYRQNSYITILNEIAKKNKLDVDDNYLRMLISNGIHNDDEKHACLVKYLYLLNKVEISLNQPIDEDLLANLYSCVSSNHELISLYRTSDFTNPENRVIIDRIYSAAPANLISSMMKDLLDVIDNEGLSTIVKSALTYYFISYIKPFAECNEEMAMIVTKTVLSHSDLKQYALNLNLEKLFTDLSDKVAKMCTEVQKNNDFTYFLNLYISCLNEQIETEINKINSLQAMSLKQEYYHDAYEEAKQSPFFEETNKIDETNFSVADEDIEINQPTNEKTSEKLETKEVPVENVSDVKEKEEEIHFTGLAISSLPPVLDEKSASRLEEHLLESDPELKRSQAYFYARHCTMGKRYTISQFKKELGCAYETARTSMDLLAKLGYYRQEMVKNKKVYTPIKRK